MVDLHRPPQTVSSTRFEKIQSQKRLSHKDRSEDDDEGEHSK